MNKNFYFQLTQHPTKIEEYEKSIYAFKKRQLLVDRVQGIVGGIDDGKYKKFSFL
jgi:hypothetical protein